MDTPLLEVYPPGDLGSDLSGPTDIECFREDNMGKDEGSLGVPGTPEYPPPF